MSRTVSQSYRASVRQASTMLGLSGKRSTAVLFAFVIGLCLRLGWALLGHSDPGAGEAGRVAIALASGRGFADAYHVGQGPTAHLMPLSPSIAALFFWLAGSHTAISRLLLACWSIALCFASYLLFNRAFAQIGVSERARAAALCYLCLIPVYLGQEAEVLGVWDGGLTVALTASVLVQLTNSQGLEASWAPVRLSATNSLLFFANPVFGASSFVSTIATICRTWRARKIASFVAFAVLGVACLIGPWAVRNERVLGTPVLTRSNAGLELSLGTNPLMLTDTPHEQAFQERLDQIHPTESRQAYQEVRRMGEVSYSQKLGEDAWKWIKEHPTDEARLMVLHLRSIFFPEPWMFRVWSTPTGSTARSALASLAGGIGFAGIVLGLIKDERKWRVISLLVFIPVLILCPFQPINRYIYSFYALLVFAAAFALDALFESRTRAAENCTSRDDRQRERQDGTYAPGTGSSQP